MAFLKNTIHDRFLSFRIQAQRLFLESVSGSSSFCLLPVGKRQEEVKTKDVNLDTKYGWTLNETKDRNFGSVLLMPGVCNGKDFILDNYDLNSPHAFRRRF